MSIIGKVLMFLVESIFGLLRLVIEFVFFILGTIIKLISLAAVLAILALAFFASMDMRDARNLSFAVAECHSDAGPCLLSRFKKGPPRRALIKRPDESEYLCVWNRFPLARLKCEGDPDEEPKNQPDTRIYPDGSTSSL